MGSRSVPCIGALAVLRQFRAFHQVLGIIRKFLGFSEGGTERFKIKLTRLYEAIDGSVDGIAVTIVLLKTYTANKQSPK